MFDYNNPYGMYGIGANYAPQQRFMPQMTNLSPQTQNAPQQPLNAPQTNMDWIRVNSMEDVANITVQPNTKAWIMLANEPVFVLKSADGMGLTTTDAYRFEKITGEKKVEYVPKAEFDELAKKFNDFVKQFEGVSE